MAGAEKVWVVSNVPNFANFVEEESKKKQVENNTNGDNITRVTKLKMRLFETCFLDEFRDNLIQMYDSNSR